jgi:hypothetical protein
MSTSTHVYTAHLTGTPDQALDVKGGSITLAAGRAPHVQADLLIGPVSQTVYAALDPRLHPRVRITVEAVTPAGVQSRTFNLGVRSRPIAYLDGEYGLTLASDEAVLLDHAPLADDATPDPMTSGRAVVNYVLGVVLPGTSLAAGDDFTIPADAADEALIWRAGDAALDFLAPLLQTAGYRLVCDEQRVWTLRGEEYVAPGYLVIRHLVNMIDANETIDRDAQLWFDAAVTRYRWTDTAGVLHEAVDAFALVTPPTLVKTFDKQTVFRGTGFSAYAVRRAQGRGREVSATAVSDWRALAEQSVEVDLPGTPRQVGVTSAVQFDLSLDEMTVTTRTTDLRLGSIDGLHTTIDALIGTIDELSGGPIGRR